MHRTEFPFLAEREILRESWEQREGEGKRKPEGRGGGNAERGEVRYR